MRFSEIVYQIKSNPKNVWYAIQGFTLMHFHTFTNHYFAPIDKLNLKMEGAKDCLDNGFCLECGCNALAMMYSDKPCPKEENKCYVG